MAIFNITNKKSSSTVILPAYNYFAISTNAANRCDTTSKVAYEIVDNDAWHDGPDNRKVKGPYVGDVIYSDVGLSTLYNLTGLQKDYNINNGLFITLDSNSVVIANPC